MEVTHMKKAVVFTFILSALLVCLGGCNTVRGFGTDLKKGGQAIERSAD